MPAMSAEGNSVCLSSGLAFSRGDLHSLRVADQVFPSMIVAGRKALHTSFPSRPGRVVYRVGPSRVCRGVYRLAPRLALALR